VYKKAGLKGLKMDLSNAESTTELLSYRPYEIAVAIQCKRFIPRVLPQFMVEYKVPALSTR
jgi:hypothetical protein